MIGQTETLRQKAARKRRVGVYLNMDDLVALSAHLAWQGRKPPRELQHAMRTVERARERRTRAYERAAKKVGGKR
jgi:hypothetical protein